MVFWIFIGIAVVLVGCLLWLHYTIKPKSFVLEGAHVLVTGGSSGIGKEIAVEAVKRGANVTLLARNEAKLADAKEHIEKFIKNAVKQTVMYISVDISGDYTAVEQAIQQAELSLGPVGVLVNSAGISFNGQFEDIPIERFRSMMDVNYFGSVFATRAVLPQMKSRRSGRIVFISSQAGQLGVFGYTGYSATKFALRGLAETLQMEVKPFGIQVCIAFPPDTDTPGLREERKTMISETRLISETSGMFEAEHVAKIILNDTVKGNYQSYMGIDGWMLSLLTCGMAPIASAFEALQQVLTMGVFRAVALFYLASFDRIVSKCLDDKMAAKTKHDDAKDK